MSLLQYCCVCVSTDEVPAVKREHKIIVCVSTDEALAVKREHKISFIARDVSA